LAVVGEVRSPGYVHVPSQSLLSDVISAAGGPTVTGNLQRVTIRRDGQTLLPPDRVTKALAAGATLDDLQVHAGDEVVVEARRSFNWTQMFQTTAILIGSAATIIAIQRR
jgi:protein involved in polysaccharide export with SLBB domain